MTAKPFYWLDYLQDDVSVDELKSKIDEYGINYKGYLNESILDAMLLSNISFEKMDLVFSYNPCFIHFFYTQSGELDYLIIDVDFYFFLNGLTEKCLYMFIKIVQSMNCMHIEGSKIMAPRESNCYTNFEGDEHDTFEIRSDGYFHSLEYSLYSTYRECGMNNIENDSLKVYKFVIKNEIRRKNKLSHIVFKKINQF